MPLSAKIQGFTCNKSATKGFYKSGLDLNTTQPLEDLNPNPVIQKGFKNPALTQKRI